MKEYTLAVLMLLLSAGALAAGTPWQNIQHPVSGPPQSIGSFANGCIIGAQSLPLNADHYQVMRQDQRRYFGHPDLIRFIQRFSGRVAQHRLGEVLIGDMGMAAGGRFSSGHASHQTGLDVDIWLQLPASRWSAQQLLHPQPLDLVTAEGNQVVARHWTPAVPEMIKLAAEDPQVSRIFVNPAIKQQLCLQAGSDRGWLRKVRPWFAHRAHMHVRLSCPAGSTECQDQSPPPPGDGCGAELHSWFLPAKPGSSPPLKRTPPPLPDGCQALLDKHLL
ncbi:MULTISPECIES: penicillin-insensitive murein endopeptidase [unclassified Tatumella]|uniref:penicillin-insensitive murein endopeptidase n=1 Tax=unclassified Tatumella TaxID=2649542 RepID=UPI001BB04F8C|nr:MULTISPECIES: penicillin-insensitive murein endopeptidase [unclassified Tatumella]MBS0876404.1 penicillin-insensitive murein endopeptidase [Tatumella sp. JGM82]MBS0889577.1 penicillin-insensitive murein endopeptidase [Tatumella sp. JGM94]MBS0900699.1 penicillin-insensitive murein endopeptidase [Tatumella sp. JGM100]